MSNDPWISRPRAPWVPSFWQDLADLLTGSTWLDRAHAHSQTFSNHIDAARHHQSFHPRGSKVWLSLQADIDNIQHHVPWNR